MSEPANNFSIPIGPGAAKPDIDDDAARILSEERGDPGPQTVSVTVREEPAAETPPAPPAKAPRKTRSEAARRAQERLAPDEPAESTRLTIPIPDYLHKQLKDRAHMSDATVRHVVLTALKNYTWKEGGETCRFDIREADMGADRRKKEYRAKSK